MNKPLFTVSDGLRVQREQMAHWKKLLNGEAYAALVVYVDRQNDNLKPDACGYDVARGGDIDGFVYNLWL